MYAACTGPPMVEHVTYVEVRVAFVFVRAPVVVGVTSPQFDTTTLLTPDRDELGPTKHPNSLPIALLWPAYVAPDDEG